MIPERKTFLRLVFSRVLHKSRPRTGYSIPSLNQELADGKVIWSPCLFKVLVRKVLPDSIKSKTKAAKGKPGWIPLPPSCGESALLTKLGRSNFKTVIRSAPVWLNLTIFAHRSLPIFCECSISGAIVVAEVQAPISWQLRDCFAITRATFRLAKKGGDKGIRSVRNAANESGLAELNR